MFLPFIYFKTDLLFNRSVAKGGACSVRAPFVLQYDVFFKLLMKNNTL